MYFIIIIGNILDFIISLGARQNDLNAHIVLPGAHRSTRCIRLKSWRILQHHIRTTPQEDNSPPYRFWSWWVVLFRGSGPSGELSWWGIVLGIVVLVGNGWALFLSGGELSSWGVVHFNTSPIYHLYVLFVENSYQARFCLEIYHPAILFTMLLGLLNRGSFIVHIHLPGGGGGKEQSVHIVSFPAGCTHSHHSPGTRWSFRPMIM